MSAGDFYLLDENGLPEAAINAAEFAAKERRISSLLAAHSRDAPEVLAIIARELQDQDMPEQVRTLLTLGVLYQLTTGVLAAFITLAEDTFPQNDYVGDLLALTIPDNHLLQGGPNTPEGPPSEGDPHV